VLVFSFALLVLFETLDAPPADVEDEVLGPVARLLPPLLLDPVERLLPPLLLVDGPLCALIVLLPFAELEPVVAED
jgi:uncharacterized protein YggT (Ycf19 family)